MALLSRALGFGLALLLAALMCGTADAQPTPVQLPDPSEEDDPEGDVDIITSAGEFKKPQPRQPSIVLDTGPKVRWNPEWRPFGFVNFIGAGLMAGLAVGSLAIPSDETRWTATNSFDNAIRNFLRPSNSNDRFRGRDASDITLALSINQVLVDTLVVTWWGHDAGKVALQMALMNIEAIAFNSGINGLVSGVASRERPYRNMCRGERAEALRDCRSSKRYRSFYSGHTSVTFTVAGLTCMHHAHLPLYGGGIADTLVCIGAFGLAASTGTLRIVGDQHWGSDVLTGAVMGTLSGTLVPYFLHYRTGDLPDVEPDAISFSILPTPTGVHMTGLF